MTRVSQPWCEVYLTPLGERIHSRKVHEASVLVFGCEFEHFEWSGCHQRRNLDRLSLLWFLAHSAAVHVECFPGDGDGHREARGDIHEDLGNGARVAQVQQAAGIQQEKPADARLFGIGHQVASRGSVMRRASSDSTGQI
jgi:hypothetical protein